MPKIVEDKLVCPHCGADESSSHVPFSEWGLKVHIARMHGPNRTPAKRRKQIGLEGGVASARRTKQSRRSKRSKRPKRLVSMVMPLVSTNGHAVPQLTLDMLMELAAQEVQNNRRVKYCPKCGHNISMSELGEAIAEKITQKMKYETQAR